MAKPPQSQSPEPDERTPQTSALAERIARAQKDKAAANAAESFRQRDLTGAGRGFRLASEFVAAILVGALIGYVIDSALGTRPWAMVVLLLLGFAAGVLNVMRAAAEIGAQSTRSGASAPDEDND